MLENLAACTFIVLLAVAAWVYGAQIGKAHDIGGILRPSRKAVTSRNERKDGDEGAPKKPEG